MALRAHLRIHEPRSGKPNICEECNATFSGKQRFYSHMKLKHGIGKIITSKKRNFFELYMNTKSIIITDVPRRKLNLNSTQPDLSRMQQFFDMRCEKCETEFSSLQHARLHYLEEHEISNGYIKCCGKKFGEVKQINEHLHYHQNPNNYKYVHDYRFVFVGSSYNSGFFISNIE